MLIPKIPYTKLDLAFLALKITKTKWPPIFPVVFITSVLFDGIEQTKYHLMHLSYKGSKYNNTNHAYCSIYTVRGYTKSKWLSIFSKIVDILPVNHTISGK